MFFKFFQHADNQFQGEPVCLGVKTKLRGSSWNWVRRLRSKMMALPGRKRCLYDIFSHLDTIHERGGQTDIHRMTGPKISNICHCTNGRIEAPKAPRSSARKAREWRRRGGRVWGGAGVSPPHRGGVCGGGCAPSPENFGISDI